MKVLVTRPRLFSHSLCNKLKALGATPIPFPTIEIIPNPSFYFTQDQILRLKTYNIAIFCSRPSVLFGMKSIKNIFPTLPKFLWMAIGPGTAKELYDQGVAKVITPDGPPYESESLLAVHELQNIKGKRIVIFRGNEGRTLLSETLTAGGAEVLELEVYQRRLPRKDCLPRLSITETAFDVGLPDVVIACSPDALHNLHTLLDTKSDTNIWQVLKTKPFILVGLRADALAANLGIRSRILANAPMDKDLIQALLTLRKECYENSYY